MSRFRNFAPQAAADLDDTVSWLLDGLAGPAGAEKLLAGVLEADGLIANRLLAGRHCPKPAAGPLPDLVAASLGIHLGLQSDDHAGTGRPGPEHCP